MKRLKSHFKFTKQERSGIFYLLFTLVLIQVGIYLYNQNSNSTENLIHLDAKTQAQINFLKDKLQKKDSVKIYPFNPNYITDYKGYTLGMSLEEIDRLHAFRATNKYVNSVAEFKMVTQVSDSLLKRISPFFKFPNWTNNKVLNESSNESIGAIKNREIKPSKIDINSATAEDLKKVNGIGDKLSARIIKFRDRLGGFLEAEQLGDVYGLEPEVVARTLKKFTVINVPKIKRISVNEASAEELSKLIYLQFKVAERIVEYRNLNGGINSLNELLKIEDFPSERFERIALYLSL